MHNKIEKVQEIVERELCGMLDQIIAANTISPAEMDMTENAAEFMIALKQLDEQSWYDDASYDSYNGGSYRRGRDANTGRYISRDSYRGMMPYYDQGYMRDSYRGGNSNGGYYDRGSFERGYSGHSIKDRMVSQLESMYDNASTDHERQIVDEWIKRIETEQQ